MTATKRELELLQEIADLRAGVPSHEHKPRNGKAPFRCTSPYCEDLGAEDPRGAPGDVNDDVERYRRGTINA